MDGQQQTFSVSQCTGYGQLENYKPAKLPLRDVHIEMISYPSEIQEIIIMGKLDAKTLNKKTVQQGHLDYFLMTLWRKVNLNDLLSIIIKV